MRTIQDSPPHVIDFVEELVEYFALKHNRQILQSHLEVIEAALLKRQT